jgi:1-acyl-sn-glycerol-3-phosphate acyltransferase
MGLYTLGLAAVAVVGTFIEPTGRLYMWIARHIWGRVVLGIGGVRLETVGGEGVDWRTPYVVCANHASQLDIPALFGALPMPVRFLAKKSLFYIPIFGWSMWLARFIPVDRSAGRKSRDALAKAAARIRKGPSLLVFPEGTRSPDGAVRKFKSGAFVMAIQAGIPVLPVAIRGSFEVFPRNTVKVTPGVIRIVIGAPVPTARYTPSDKEALRQQVEDAVTNMHRTGLPQ